MRRALIFACSALGFACPGSELTVAPTPTDCLFIPRTGAFCDQGRCSLTVPPEALDEPTYLVFEERPFESNDAIGGVTCFLGPELEYAQPASIRISYDEPNLPEFVTEDELLAFVVLEDGQALLPDAPLNATEDEVEVRTSGSIEVGLTAVPKAIVATDEYGSDVLEVTDPVSFLRNLSSAPMEAAFFDGQRFYLGNGPRVLIYRDGIPDDPTALPDVIVGKPNLEARSNTVNASNIVGKVSGIWSDGDRLVVSAGNRVLIWSSIPTESFIPADLVLGQDGFTSNAPNGGRDPAPNTLWQPDDVTSDGTKLLVADSSNNRVLVWETFPVLNNQPADQVIGQGDFNENRIRGGAIPIYQARGLYIDPERIVVGSSLVCTCLYGLDDGRGENNPAADFFIGYENPATRVGPSAFPQPAGMSRFAEGGFALRDAVGRRVSLWQSFPETEDQPPDLMIGKPDPLLAGPPLGLLNASALGSPSATAGVYADAQRLIVADGQRVLVWKSLPEHSYAPADLVFGQPSFTTAEVGIDYRNISAKTLAHPADISEALGVIAIADRSNNRVLLIDGESMGAQGEPVVLGQRAADAFYPNGDWRSISAETLNGPEGVATDGVRLVVADTGNHRVLIYNQLPTAHGAPADVVLGQADFVSGRPNMGMMNGAASASSMFYPADVHIEGDTLFVADTFNHRVLTFSPIPSGPMDNGQAATGVFGGDLVNGGEGWFLPQSDGLALPAGLTVGEDGTLWIADQENNRVVGVPPPYTGPATQVIGQPDLLTNHSPTYFTPPSTAQGVPISQQLLETSTTTLRKPRGVAVQGDTVIVSDTDGHRLVGYTRGAEGWSRTWMLGQDDPSSRAENGGGLGPSSFAAPGGLAVAGEHLLVADMNNHRTIAFLLSDGVPQPMALQLFGQADFISRGINQSASASALLAAPSGVVFEEEKLFVADRLNHRVLVFQDDGIVQVLGQPDRTHTLKNAGESPSAATMNEPTDLSLDGGRLVVVDRANHRVLLWDELPSSSGQPADVIIGQPDGTRNAPNAGQGLLTPGPNTLLAPEGAYLRGETLYIADTGNNRVLIFDGIPTEDGASADRVLCQADMRSNLGNRGERFPADDRCSGPTDVKVVEDRLYVADALNNRVLVFDSSAQAPLKGAVLVLGQPDFESRRASNEAGGIDASTMSSPSSIEHDGANLFVVDRGNHRVLVYSVRPELSGTSADRVFGQYTFESSNGGGDINILQAPQRISVQVLPFRRTRVFVADSGKDRIVRFDGVPRP